MVSQTNLSIKAPGENIFPPNINIGDEKIKREIAMKDK